MGRCGPRRIRVMADSDETTRTRKTRRTHHVTVTKAPSRSVSTLSSPSSTGSGLPGLHPCDRDGFTAALSPLRVPSESPPESPPSRLRIADARLIHTRYIRCTPNVMITDLDHDHVSRQPWATLARSRAASPLDSSDDTDRDGSPITYVTIPSRQAILWCDACTARQPSAADRRVPLSSSTEWARPVLLRISPETCQVPVRPRTSTL